MSVKTYPLSKANTRRKKIKIITVKEYATFWNLHRNTAIHIYNRDLAFLKSKFGANSLTVLWVNGWLTNFGFKEIYKMDFDLNAST